jgi:ABC-2 type transport system permease protein
MYTAIFPSFQQQSANLVQLVNSFPESFQKAFNIDTNFFSSLPAYLAGEKYSLTWQLLALLLVISRAGQALAGEIEKGTMSFMLMLPISRLKLYFGKYLSGMVAIVLFVIATVLGEIPIAAAFGLKYPIKGTLFLAVLGLAFAWAIYALSFAISAAVSERSKMYFAMGGLAILMYVADIVSKLKPDLNWIGKLSLFHYFEVNEFLVLGQFKALDIVVFMALAAVATIIGAVIFMKRDISV